MSPNEAAELLGVPPSASGDEVQRAYTSRLAEAGGDQQRLDALAVARDALLAASPWRPPGVPHGQAPLPPAAAPPSSRPPQQQTPLPPAAAPPSSRPQQPVAPGSHPGYAQYPPTAPAQPAPGGWYAPPPPPPPRRPMSTGAIVGITLGAIAAGLVVFLVAVFAIAAVGASAGRLAEAGSSSRATPFEVPPDEPSDEPSDSPSGGPSDGAGVEDYDIDGVHVHYVDGWTFELTPAQSCAGATVTAGFAETPDGDTMDEWSTTVDLEAGVALTFTIPDDASVYDYAGIDSVQCGQV